MKLTMYFNVLMKIVLIGTVLSAVQSKDLQMIEERAWTLCLDSLWNSCVGRCGDRLSGPPYLCACDLECEAYNDCCLDFEYECIWDLDLWNKSDHKQLLNTGRMSCVGLSTTMEYGVLMISSCASWWPKPIVNDDGGNNFRAQCIDPNTSSLKPVIGERFGVIYKNVDCATCNGVRHTRPWPVAIECNSTTLFNRTRHHKNWLFSCSLELDITALNGSNARACAYKIGECPVSSSSEEETVVVNNTTAIIANSEAEMCTSYSKPIMVINDDQSVIIYKNVHCARCNGYCFNMLYCPVWEILSLNRDTDVLDTTRTVYYESGVSADVRGSPLPNLPAAFSILFYFHQSGSLHTFFSSQEEKWKDECDDNQIWDPFWDTCRDVYCSAQFTLINYHCVDNSNSNGGIPISNITYSNITQFDNVDVTQVKLYLELQMDVVIDESMEALLKGELIGSLAEVLNATPSRFINYTSYNMSFVNGSFTNKEEISLILLGPHEQHEPTIEKITSTIAYGVSLNQFWLKLNSSGQMLKIYGIQEKIIQITNNTENMNETDNSWCSDGRQLIYQNDQFTPIVYSYSNANKSLNIYINSTGEMFLPGEFVGNILMEGDQGSVLVNVSGAVIVCDQSYHNNSCLRVMIGPKEYMPLPNGSIEYTGNETVDPNVYLPQDFDILPNGNALVCLTVIKIKKPDDYSRILTDLRAQSYLTTILLSFSSIAIFATIITYFLFSSLRNLPGLTILNLCFCLLAFQLLYLCGQRFSVYLKPKICYGVAVFLHWTILSAFFWMNVIAFDLFWTFSHLMTTPLASKRSKKTIVYYGIYGYGMASLVVGACIIFDQFTKFHIDYATKGLCWIGNPLALSVAFAGVIGVVIAVNVVFYVLTVLRIRKMASKTKLVTGYGVSRNQMSIYIRISTLMGFTWILGYLEGNPEFPYALHDVFAYAFIISNCLSGVFIFVAFACNRKVVLLYRKCRLTKWLQKTLKKAVIEEKCHDCKQPVTKCTCQKTVIRTISNETVQSVLVADDDEETIQQT